MAYSRTREACEEACDTDDVSLLVEAFNLASCPDSSECLEDLLPDCMRTATIRRSMRVLVFLLENYQDYVHHIEPEDLVLIDTDKDDRTFSPAPNQTLELLYEHGYNINSLGLPQSNSVPLLWRICNVPELVQWCLDHDAALVIPGETTSIHPFTGDIFHTPRHPLLLEMVSAYGTVATFRKLLDKGAPLTPGSSWRKENAPRLLHSAVVAASDLAPRGTSPSSIDYRDHIEMIKYLVEDLKLNVNQVGGRSESLVQPIVPYFGWPDIQYSKENRNIQEIIDVLLAAGADLNFTLKHHGFDQCLTPLSCARYNNEESFSVAVEHWQIQYRSYMANRKSRPPEFKATLSVKSADVGRLEKLPAEVLNMIGVLLDLQDIRNLRLVSRRISNGIFESFSFFFCTRKCSLTIADVSALIETLSQGEKYLVNCTEEIVISSAEADNSECLHVLLEDLFAVAMKKAKLKSLDIRTATGSELNAILHALCRSELRLRSFSLYHGAGSSTGAIDFYRVFSELENLAVTLSSVRSFKWSLSITQSTSNRPAHSLEAQLENVATINKILSMMPRIEFLDLFWYKFYPGGTLEAYFFESCLPILLQMKLKELALSGLHVTEKGIYQLIEQTSATRVTLRQIRLRDGSWKATVDILTGGKFNYFHIDDIYEHHGGGFDLVRFDVPGCVKYRTLHGGVGPSEIVKEGLEAFKKLEYRFSHSRVMGSSQASRYFRAQRRDFGSDGL